MSWTICVILPTIFMITGLTFGLAESVGRLPFVATPLVLIGIGSAKTVDRNRGLLGRRGLSGIAGGPDLITSKGDTLPTAGWNAGDRVITLHDRDDTRRPGRPAKAGLAPIEAQGSGEIRVRHREALVVVDDAVTRAVHAISTIPQVRGFRSIEGSRGNHE